MSDICILENDSWRSNWEMGDAFSKVYWIESSKIREQLHRLACPTSGNHPHHEDLARMARRSNQNSIRSSPSIPSNRSKSDGAGPGVRRTVMYGAVVVEENDLAQL